MKIYIQSKSGDFNVNTETVKETLRQSLEELRHASGYYALRQGKEVFVPFEEIEHIAPGEGDEVQP